MTEIRKNLYVDNETDYEYKVRDQEGWNVIHACKEPYHRLALGYSGRGAPKDHPEYLMAKKENRLIFNLVDVENPAYIAKEIMDEALQFIDQSLEAGRKVLVHCNQGMSRSPGINMAGGMRGFLGENWDEYMNPRK